MVSEAAPSYNERGTCNNDTSFLGTLRRWIKELSYVSSWLFLCHFISLIAS